MKVNNISQQKFQGLYIIKGTGRDVAKATYEICRRSSSPEMQAILKDQALKDGFVYKIKETIPELAKITYHSLTGYYSESQPLVQNIIATNNEISIIDRFCEKLYSLEFLDQLEAFDVFSFKRFADTLLKVMDKEEAEIIRYEEANQKCNEGNPSPLTDFILEKVIQAKTHLAKMLAPYGKKEEDVKALDAKTVLNAIEQELFDYVEGRYKVF